MDHLSGAKVRGNGQRRASSEDLPKNIILRGSVYYLRIQVEGKDVRRSLGKNLEQAKAEARSLLDELQGPSGMMRVERFAQRWLSERIAQGRSGQQQSMAAQRYRDYIAPAIGRCALSEVTQAEFRRIRTTCEGQGLAPATVKHVLGDARSLFRYAVECDVIAVSPFRSSVMPRLRQQAPKRLEDAELRQLMDLCPEEYLLAVKVALGTGVRWGELHNLKWKHVLKAPVPHLLLENTKSGRIRRVPLSQELASFLERSRGETGTYVLPFRWRWGPDRMVKKLCKVSGLKFHWHQLRHSFACRYLEAGGTLASLQQILGHSTVLMTQRYAALSDASVFAEAKEILGTI